MLSHIIILFVLIMSFTLNSFGQTPTPTATAPTPPPVDGKQYDASSEYGSMTKCGSSSSDDFCKKLSAQLVSNETFITKVETAVSAARAAATAVPAQLACASVDSVVTPKLAPIKAQQTTCSEGTTQAEKLCSLSTNPKIQAGISMMQGLTQSLTSMSSAKDTCEKTSSVNFLSQGIVGVGAAACAMAKSKCEAECTIVDKSLTELQTSVDSVTAGCVPAQAISSLIKVKQAEKKIDVAKCEAYAPNLAQMFQLAAGMLQAAMQSKQCAEDLAGVNTPNQTIDQMCANAANASLPSCSCRTNNTAPGCPGYMASLNNEGNLKQLNDKGVAKMAGLTYGSKITPSGVGGGLGNLSDEAKAILNPPTDDSKSSGMFGSSSGANAGSAGATGPGAGAAEKGKPGAEESKSLGSSFANAVGAAFRGAFGGGGSRPTDSKLSVDKYKDLKRQIAADQARSEISNASGMDNWIKVKMRYRSNVNSFMDSN